VVLLHLLRFAVPRQALRLTAAHFDHRMREGSGADTDWVRGLCRAWSIPLEWAAAAAPPVSEASARKARYAFLERTAVALGAERIATAHQADDQAETVLFRLLRGSGLRGLAGIPPRRGNIVRPLLGFRRSEIAAYARRCSITWREDPTNRDLRFTRNRLRHDALPALEAAWAGATKSLLSLGREAAQAESALEALTQEALERVTIEQAESSVQLARTLLLGYHPLVRARVIRASAGRLGRGVGRATTRAALAFIAAGGSGGAVDLSGGLRLERHFDRLLLRSAPATHPGERPLIIDEAVPGSGTARIGGRTLHAEWSLVATAAPDAAVTLAPAAIRFPLELRAWRPGDRIRFDSGSKKLKKLFLERRVPRHQRERVPILAEAGGRVIWVSGIARAAQTGPIPGGPVFQIRVTDGNDD
jgi:tRNA(Ile)-lysidine synthase